MTYNPGWSTGGGGGVTDGDKGDIVVSGSGATWALDSAVATTAGRALMDDADAAAQRATLGLGTAATSAATDFAAAVHTHDASAITAGTLPLARGGTGGTDAATARTALGVRLPSFVRKTVDQTAIGTSYADITSLSFAVLNGVAYYFKFAIVADADAATTGIDVAVNGPASPTVLTYTQRYWTSTTVALSVRATAYDANTASTGSNGTAQRVFEVEGIVQPSADGTLAARIKRENVGTGPNVRANSWGLLLPLG